MKQVFYCNQCAASPVVMKQKGRQWGIYCSQCGAHIQWLKRVDIKIKHPQPHWKEKVKA